MGGVQRRTRGKMAILCFALVASAINTCVLTQLKFGVTVRLEATYYDVSGNAVDLVYLAPGEGKILFTQPGPMEGKNYSELIRPGKSIRLGCYFYGGYSAGSVDYITNNFDVVSLAGGMSSEDLSSARLLNPNLRFYKMALGAWWNGPLNETTENWVLRLNDGSPADVVRANPPSSYEMDFGNAEFAQWFAEVQIQRCNDFGADGVAIDEIMWDGYWGMEDMSNYGEDPKDYRDYTSVDEIRDSCYSFLQRIHSVMEPAGVEIISQAFWPAAQQYQDGIWGETAFKACWQERTMDLPNQIWKEICPLTWEGTVKNIIDAGNRSYIWACWYNWEDMTELEYGISTYLMAKQNGQFNVGFHPFGYQEQHGWPSSINGWNATVVQLAIENHPEYFDIEMGDALGEMVRHDQQDGYYWRREFENGIVLVNPHVPVVLDFASS